MRILNASANATACNKVFCSQSLRLLVLFSWYFEVPPRRRPSIFTRALDPRGQRSRSITDMQLTGSIWLHPAIMGADINRTMQLRFLWAVSVEQPCVTTVCHWTPSSRNWKVICSDNDEHNPVPMWCFCDSFSLTYWLTNLIWRWTKFHYMMRYDSVYLMCSKKLTCSQLRPPHGTNRKIKVKTY